MQYKAIEKRHVQFPSQTWNWLRPQSRFPENLDAAFLFGVETQDGLQRWHWALKGSTLALDAISPETQIGVLYYPAVSSELEAYWTYLESVFSVEKPNDLEWVCVLKTLRDYFTFDLATSGIPTALARTMALTGLSPHLGAFSTRGRFCFLSHNEIQFLYQRNWNPEVFELLEGIDSPVREELLRFISRWNLTSGQSKESVLSISLLFRRFGSEAGLRVLSKEYTSTDAARSALLSAAQPEFSRLSQERLEKLRALAMPPRTTVFGDPSFENDQIKISHTPKSIDDFNLFKDWILDPKTEEKLKQLLEFYQ